MYEANLENFRKNLYHLPESREKENPILMSAERGREVIRDTVKTMNDRYDKLVKDVQKLSEVLVVMLKKQGKEHAELEDACLLWCETIEQLLEWVSETERLLAREAASPADIKLIEERIQEQKVREAGITLWGVGGGRVGKR